MPRPQDTRMCTGLADRVGLKVRNTPPRTGRETLLIRWRALGTLIAAARTPGSQVWEGGSDSKRFVGLRHARNSQEMLFPSPWCWVRTLSERYLIPSIKYTCSMGRLDWGGLGQSSKPLGDSVSRRLCNQEVAPPGNLGNQRGVFRADGWE